MAAQSVTPDNPLCFVHIPKTAGTAISHSLASLFNPDEVFHGQTVYDYENYSKEELAHYKYFSGHIPRDCFPKLPPDTRYFTFVRDPVRRTISHYRYFRKIYLSGNFETLRPEEQASIKLAGTKDLIDWVRADDPFTIISVRNQQIAQLVPSSMFWSKPPAEPTDILAEAFDVLAGFVHVGVTELLPVCWEVLSWKLGRALPPLLTLNATEGTDRFQETREVRKALAEFCPLDIELYDFCLKRAAAEIREYLDHWRSLRNAETKFTVRR
jgi:hypothetical protein